MKERRQKATRLADLDRHSRTLIVREVIDAMLGATDGFLGDVLDEEAMRRLAAQLDVPFMALHQLIDGRVTTDDMREWCRFEGGRKVA